MTKQKKIGASTADRSAAPEGRKAYHAPKLEDYGEVGELTQTSDTQHIIGLDGGPTWPYNYTSGPV
jgi:hypothetical protein